MSRDPIYDPCPLCHAEPGSSCSPDCDTPEIEECEPVDTWPEHEGHRGAVDSCALCKLDRALHCGGYFDGGYCEACGRTAAAHGG